VAHRAGRCATLRGPKLLLGSAKLPSEVVWEVPRLFCSSKKLRRPWFARRGGRARRRERALDRERWERSGVRTAG
jgi:hypothetical protein